MSNEAIKPCDFCGSADDLSVEIYAVQPDNFHSGYVECHKCEARGPNALTVDGWLGSQDEARAEAIAAWNRRTAHVEQGGAEKRVIGWRTDDYLHETADRDMALNWEPNVNLLPIFEGDTQTKLTHPAPVAPVPEGQETVTNRGFALIKFDDRNGVACSLQKSSVATEEAIWFGCDDADPRVLVPGQSWQPVAMPEGYIANTRMHLSQERVRELLPILQNFVETGEVTTAPTPPATGSIGDDAEFCDRVHAYRQEPTDERFNALTALIDARTPAGNTSQGAVLTNALAALQNIRDVAVFDPNGSVYYAKAENALAAAECRDAAPPPPAAVAPEQAEVPQCVAEKWPHRNIQSFTECCLDCGQNTYDAQYCAKGKPQQAAPPQDTSVRDALQAYVNFAAMRRDEIGELSPEMEAVDAQAITALKSSPPAQSVALSDAEIERLWQSLPGIEIHNAAAKVGQDTQYSLRLAFARAIIARISGKGA